MADERSGGGAPRPEAPPGQHGSGGSPPPGQQAPPGQQVPGHPPPPGPPPPPGQPPPAAYGTPYVLVPQWPAAASHRKENALAIVGLVCSIAGVALLLLSFGFLWVLTLPLSIAGLVCGLLGRRKVDRGELETGRGLGQAGFVVGIVGVVLHVLVGAALVFLLGVAFDTVEGFRIPRRDGPPRLDKTTLSMLQSALRA